MKPYYEHAGIQIFHGDCREILPQLEGFCCCVTSPPYWGLRDYGHEAQMGLESSPEAYVSGMRDVFAAVRNGLTSGGTLWLNLGDSYIGSHGAQGRQPGTKPMNDKQKSGRPIELWPVHPPTREIPTGLKPKDMAGIPWRVAFALQAEGWYLRSDIIWHKPNPMPESVTDRPTKSHEYIFLMSKSETYYYDAEAIKEEAVCGDPRKPYAPGQVDARGNGHDRGGGKVRESVKRGGFGGKTQFAIPGRESFRAIEDYRNKRSVWTVTTKPLPEAHFAAFPPDLIQPCILAGCHENGVVLDPFAGAGTTLLVAKKNRCKAIGIEIEEKYCEIAAKRLSQEVLNFSEAKP